MASAASAVSRIFLGEPLRTDRLGETLLPKRLALPVFCSDPLSSVADAAAQIVLVLGLGGLALLEVLIRNEGKLISQKELLQEVWGPAHETETNYLRVYTAQLRRKLEPDPSHPRHLITEPDMGYRFVRG
jgi:DNA-binding response OmpR family regulator